MQSAVDPGERGAESIGCGTETCYLLADHLGSTRLVTDTTAAFQHCLDYFPFGEELLQGTGGRLDCYAPANEPTQKFTGKERDSATGLDYFGARYLSSAEGRFTSPDPNNPVMIAQLATRAGLPTEAAGSQMAAFLENPQGWNRYTYVLNNPLRFVDPFGEAPVDGHHLITGRNGLAGLAREFAEFVKAGEAGVGYPNQPGFNGPHRAYNAAVEQILQSFEQQFGAARNSWSLSQWKQAASSLWQKCPKRVTSEMFRTSQ